MLFDMVLDPAGLDRSRSSRSARDFVRDTLDSFGVLHHTDEEIRAIRSQLSGDPDEWSKWKEVLIRVPRAKRTGELSDTFDAAAVGIGRTTAGLVVLSADRATDWLNQLGLPSDSVCERVPSTMLEMVKADDVSVSATAGLRREWAASQLAAPMTGTEIWGERMRGLFASSSNISIVDGYALARRDYRLGEPGRSGLPWLLDRLPPPLEGRSAPALTIRTMKPEPPFEMWSVLDDLWNRARGSIREMKIAFVEERLFKGIEHRRYLRFSTEKANRMVTLDHSLDRLSDLPITPPVTFTYWLPRPAEVAMIRASEKKLWSCAERDSATFHRS